MAKITFFFNEYKHNYQRSYYNNYNNKHNRKRFKVNYLLSAAKRSISDSFNRCNSNINYNNNNNNNNKNKNINNNNNNNNINNNNNNNSSNGSNLYGNYGTNSAYCRLLTCFLSIWSCLSLITTITMTSATPQGCILCDNGDLKGKYHQHNYEEFRYEHQVTRQDAITALRQLNESFYEGSSCNSIRCTNKVMKYCFSSQFINDHCLCELAHNVEGLPFVPHICYVGEKAHKPSVGSCFLYEEVKDCCCAPALATQWRHISIASKIEIPYFVYLVITCIYFW